LSRNIALDILKVTLAFMVVGLHADFLADITSTGSYLTVNGIFRIAVPLFLLINGFYFYSVLANQKTANWIKKVLSLYVFWMLFYSYFWFRPSELSFVEFAKIAKTLILGYFHLWYIPGMLGAAILVILFKKQSPKLMFLGVFIAFTAGVTIQYVGNYHLSDNLEIDKWFNSHWFHRSFIFFAYPFFCIGYLIHKLNFHENVSLKTSIILSIVGFSLLIIESYSNYIEPSRDGGFDNFASLLVVCPAVFLLFMKLNFRGKSKGLALYSTGIYFIHKFFLYVFGKFANYDETVLTFVVLVSSIITTFFLIKINRRLKFIL